MKIETNLGTVMIVGGVAFLIGAQYGYYRTRDKVLTEIAKAHLDSLIKEK